MRHPILLRLLAALALAGLALPLAVGAVVAADGPGLDDRVLVSVNGDLTLAAGETAEVIVVVDGDAIIDGTAEMVTVVGGTLTLNPGSIVDTVGVVNGTATISAGATVTRDVLELNSRVLKDEGASVGGQVRSVAVDVAAIGVVLGILGVIAWIAFALIAWAAGLALAAFGARQVRSAEWLISSEPLKTFLVGVAMVLVPPIVAVLLMATVVLAPVGLALLFVAWPALAFLGWLVGSTWIGEWILRVSGRPAPEPRPYLGVTIGLLVATLLSLIPLAGMIISLFGLGAVTLAGWRTLRLGALPQPMVPGAAPMAPAT